MKIGCFLDTNVLIYAATGRMDDPRKFGIAEGIVFGRSFGLSAQVLAEFCVNVARAAVAPTAQELDGWIDYLVTFPVVPVDAALVKSAIACMRRFQIHYYDAAIVTAAARLGAELLYTEDLNHGQRYGTVLVQNPFRDP